MWTKASPAEITKLLCARSALKEMGPLGATTTVSGETTRAGRKKVSDREARANFNLSESLQGWRLGYVFKPGLPGLAYY